MDCHLLIPTFHVIRPFLPFQRRLLRALRRGPGRCEPSPRRLPLDTSTGACSAAFFAPPHLCASALTGGGIRVGSRLVRQRGAARRSLASKSHLAASCQRRPARSPAAVPSALPQPGHLRIHRAADSRAAALLEGRGAPPLSCMHSPSQSINQTRFQHDDSTERERRPPRPAPCSVRGRRHAPHGPPRPRVRRGAPRRAAHRTDHVPQAKVRAVCELGGLPAASAPGLRPPRCALLSGLPRQPAKASDRPASALRRAQERQGWGRRRRRRAEGASLWEAPGTPAHAPLAPAPKPPSAHTARLHARPPMAPRHRRLAPCPLAAPIHCLAPRPAGRRAPAPRGGGARCGRSGCQTG